MFCAQDVFPNTAAANAAISSAEWAGGALRFSGPLANIGRCGDKDVEVVLADGVTSFLPLSTSFAEVQGKLTASNASNQSL